MTAGTAVTSPKMILGKERLLWTMPSFSRGFSIRIAVHGISVTIFYFSNYLIDRVERIPGENTSATRSDFMSSSRLWNGARRAGRAVAPLGMTSLD